MSRCVYTEARLRALVDGELEPGESRKILAHLEECAACRDAHARVQSVVTLLQEQELDETPAHFSADLQVRLTRHRQQRAGKQEFGRRVLGAFWGRGRSQAGTVPRARASLYGRPRRRWRWLGGLTTIAAAAGVCLLFLAPKIEAAEVARRAELSWLQIRNYGCVFESRGVYRGQERVFRQRQFYRRPGEFRLDTAQDYPLSTYVYGDRVIHYLRGGDWQGKGPLVIIRPRQGERDALPFPTGVTGQTGGNISLDQLIRQLNDNQDAELLGKESVGDRECYRLQYSAVPPGGSQRERYDLWVDTESFLPRRVSWYRDPQNHIVTEARHLQVNYDVLPAGTFDFAIPEGACVIEGDIDPHVLALPAHRQPRFNEEPVDSAREEAWARSRSVPFPVLSPRWLPEGYKLVRVRRKAGRWVDTHWLRQGPDGRYAVLKLVQQDARAVSGEDLPQAEAIRLPATGGRVTARLYRRTDPYSQIYLSWLQGGTRCTLFAAELPRADVLKIVASIAEVEAPARRIATRRIRKRVEERGEASALPEEPASIALAEPTPLPAEAPPAILAEEQPPMMPETADDDRPAAAVP